MNFRRVPRTLSYFLRLRFVGVLIATIIIGVSGLDKEIQADESLANQIWVVSTRDASSCAPSVSQASRIKFWSCHQRSRWQPSTANHFFDCVNGDLAADPMPLCIYVHENRVSAEEAWGRARSIYCQLQQASQSTNDRFRLVVISWPSDRIGVRPRPDAQIKAQRSEMHGYYLAWLLDQIDARVPVRMFGHSYGPRMITSALHLWGGGTIAGYRLPLSPSSVRPSVRVALLASALDANWLLPHQHHGRALTQVEHMMIAYNPRDSVLHWYPRLYGRGGPPALGYVGMSTSSLGADGYKVQQINFSGNVGKTHSWDAYAGNPAVMSQLASYLLAKPNIGSPYSITSINAE
ncbi:hypothetical protein Pla52o_29330 [Novipirellula galeiformis]|uniref:Alpha/beta hydrolase family protein n=1 Tax=Novipirellula galeiformis TaxID=2528004 RepID=A0A5C6CI88_9BACT|nr:hypothetical protein [Novipirellula galeiformis]TWU23397.1 hypothetical protein Pla52o_29330 [Novipirellula galeiformis]